MSLQLAAQHMASRGRGPDTTLVHMAPQEVAGLQALAKAHGGSLTTNPDTGLPEAGFLSSILPLVAGAFLGPAGLGLTAMQAGLAAGALGTVATGSLKKGLMAGLGAFGGAGLAGSLVGAGTSAGLGAAAGEAAAAGTAAETAALAEAQAAQSAMANTTASTNAAAAATPDFTALNATQTQFGAFGEMPGSFVPPTQAASMVPTTVAMPELSASAVNQMSVDSMLKAGFTPEQIAASAQEYAANTAGNAASPFTAGTSAALDSPMKAGFGELMKRPGDFMTKQNLQYGLAGLAPVAMDMMTPKQREIAEKEKLQPYRYDFNYNPVADVNQGYTGAYTGERTQFNPIYTRTAAGGGLMDIGPVESMSRSNQSQMAPAYAQGGVSDMAVNPYTGAEMFAEGGDTKAVRRVEDDPYYTMSGQSGEAYKYLMGQGPKPMTAMPAPVAMVPVQSTVQPAAVAEQNPGGLMGRVMGVINPRAGYGESDTSGMIRPYSFDPNTGTFTAVAVPKRVAAPAPEPAPTMDYGSFTGGGFAQGGIASLAQGGPSHLGDYSDGGRLLKGPGDGVSDSIPATIADKRPARLADGEFVVPARIVSELGNGSTEAGARKLYAMMDRVQKARKKSIGKNQVAVNSRAEKMLPA
jgi:hypothetical protein